MTDEPTAFNEGYANFQAFEHTSKAIVAYAQAGATGDEIADAIPRIHAAFMATLRSIVSPANLPKQEPAVPVKKSITHDYIICLEDGSKHRSMKRYLANKFGMTPEEYRSKWGLPKDYPITAPEYSARRSQFAKDSGLGKKK